MNKINYFFQKIKSFFNFVYICSFYLIYFFKLRKKIKKILFFSEKDMELSFGDQEEQALPGFKKYRKNGWYLYMFGRYLYSVKYIKGKKILDSGSGMGWGSFLISDFAREIIAIDINKKAVAFSLKNWKVNNINFLVHSVLKTKELNDLFDVILSFEVIEHLEFIDGVEYVKQIFSCLNNEGVLIMSSLFPSFDYVAREEEKKNIYHKHVFTKSEMEKFLFEIGFREVKFLGNLMVVAIK